MPKIANKINRVFHDWDVVDQTTEMRQTHASSRIRLRLACPTMSTV